MARNVFTALMCCFVAATLIRAEIIPAARMVDWEGATGVAGGIPTRSTIYFDLVEDGEADATGENDATAILQGAINACPAGQVVLIPAGTFRLSSTILLKSNITVRGAGRTATTLKFYLDAEDPQTFFAARYTDYYGTPPNAQAITAGNTKGSTSVTVAATTGLVEGGYALIDHLNPEFVTDGVLQGYTYLSREDGTRLMGQMVEITDITGGVITFTPALAYAYDDEPEIVPYANVYEGIGIESLRIENANETITGSSSGGSIRFAQVVDSWIHDVSLNYGDAYQIHLLHCLRVTVSKSDWSEAFQYTASRAYGLTLGARSTACLIENNWSYKCRPGFTNEGAGPWNVFAYNYGVGTWNTSQASSGLIRDANANHGGAPHMILWEGNVMNQMSADVLHAGSGWVTFLRNRVFGWQADCSLYDPEYYQRAISLNKGNWYYNVVGNVLGSDQLINSYFDNTWTYEATDENSSNTRPYIWRLGFLGAGYGIDNRDAQVAATLIRHGNYDVASAAVVWDEAILDRDIPESLYLSAKPAWFGALTWPPFDPSAPTDDPESIPAGYRYINGEDPPAESGELGVPTSVAVTAIAVNAVTVTWTDPVGAETVKIELSTSTGGGFVQVANVAAVTETLTVRGLTPGATYYVRLRGWTEAAGNSAYSAEADATTPVISGRSVRPQSAGGAGLW